MSNEKWGSSPGLRRLPVVLMEQEIGKIIPLLEWVFDETAFCNYSGNLYAANADHPIQVFNKKTHEWEKVK